MSILGKLGSLFETESEPSTGLDWKNLTVEEELDHILSESTRKPQVLYKHSSRCATSFFALKNIETLNPLEQEQADFYLVDVIAQRELSRYIADKFGIRHESPQLFVFKNGEIVWHGSHNQIQSNVIKGLV